MYRICEGNAIDQLTTYNFAGFTDEVEATISFKARNVDPRIRPNYSRILYSWHTLRGDYRNGTPCHLGIHSYVNTRVAALAMYQCARKLHDIVTTSSALLAELADEELEAYMIAMNSLSLVDPKNAWILIPGSVESERDQVCQL